MCSVKSKLLALALLQACGTLAKEMSELEALSPRRTHCSYEYAYDMYGAYCAGLRLAAVPALRAGVEILDLSDNKLREIQSDTLSAYTSVKFLYLAENQIYAVDDDAFASLTDLQSLDLSRNVITELPVGVFRLPSLRKLYLGGNPLIHMTSDRLRIDRPIAAPLELLDVSDCKLRRLPDWGVLPQLRAYNVSANPLVALDAAHFASMCRLAEVDISSSIDDIDVCRLKPVILWFTEKRINFRLDDYTKLNSREFENCPYSNVSEALNATYHRCKTEYLQIQSVKTMRRTWLTVGGGLAGFLVGFILLLYAAHRHNVARSKAAAAAPARARPLLADGP